MEEKLQTASKCIWILPHTFYLSYSEVAVWVFCGIQIFMTCKKLTEVRVTFLNIVRKYSMLFGLDIYESKFNTNNVWFQSREGIFFQQLSFLRYLFYVPMGTATYRAIRWTLNLDQAPITCMFLERYIDH